MNVTLFKTIAWIAAGVTAIVSTAFVIDERYAHAQSVYKAQRSVELKVDESALEMRQWIIEDRILQIESKPEAKRTDTERALLERYKRDAHTTEIRLRSIKGMR